MMYTIAAAFLTYHKDVLSNELRNWIANKQVKLIDHTAIVRKNITGASSIYDLIDDETAKVDGVSTIKGKSLNKNEAIVFDKISLAYGTDAETGKEGAVKYGHTDIAALNNANFVLTQNGRVVVDLPVSNLIKPAGNGFKEDDKFTELSSLAYLVDDQPMDWRLRFPAGTPLPAITDTQQYLEVKIKGLKTLRNIS